ncbi:hypothetical protein DEO72_LG11g2488 [Vigna unguiculata]|uniref:Uncharacterized protein n=1 Tax=Vigna unguiculata TaxID=3917 RepID=A0A4D6NUK6_VIGUN|nr:hypothetical protein DEO72_LG11g2488 [Vigna unguiculata]
MSELCISMVLLLGIAFCVCNSENVWFYRPSEPGSLRLENQGRENIGTSTFRPGEGSEIWATVYLAQVSASRLSEKSSAVVFELVHLAHPRGFRLSENSRLFFVECLTCRLGEGVDVRRMGGTRLSERNLDQGMLCHERVGSWMKVTRDDMSGEVHIQLLSCENTSKVGSYGSAHTREMLRAGSENVWFYRPSEPGSLRLENQGRENIGTSTFRPGEGSEIWATVYLAQVSASRLSEKSSAVVFELVHLAHPRGFRLSENSRLFFVECLTCRLGEGVDVRRMGGTRLSDSPFLFVYGDDRVILYTGADGVSGDAENAQATE